MDNVIFVKEFATFCVCFLFLFIIVLLYFGLLCGFSFTYLKKNPDNVICNTVSRLSLFVLKYIIPFGLIFIVSVFVVALSYDVFVQVLLTFAFGCLLFLRDFKNYKNKKGGFKDE